MENDQL